LLFPLVSGLIDEAVILAASAVQSLFYVAAVSSGRHTDFPCLQRQLNSIACGAQRDSSQPWCEMAHSAPYFGNGKRPAPEDSFVSAAPI
jgi:hypothetical protein